jgi:hypothetical protein
MERNIRFDFILLLKTLIKNIEPSAPRVIRNLAIPRVGGKFREPRFQFSQIVARQLADGTLNLLDTAHENKIPGILCRASRKSGANGKSVRR